MTVQVVIPTYKRAGALVGAEYFEGARYVLPDSQRDEYRKVLPADRMVVIPDDQDGSIVKKRNWILENIERPVVMIDDDVQHIGYFEGRRGTKAGGAHRPKVLDRRIFLDWCAQSFDMAEQFGTVLWGCAQNADNRIYKENKPFTLRLPVLGPFTGHLRHGFRYDPRMGTKEDYDMALQVLRAHRCIFRWEKFHYLAAHGDNAGGIVAGRTMAKEVADCRAIEKKWGRKVISYPLEPKNMADLLNGRVRVPIGGV